MTEAIMIVVGGIVLLIGLFVVGIGVGLSMSFWEAWWLYPLWETTMMPLGLPPITFWQFFAANIFISTLFMAVPLTDYAKEENTKTKKIAAYSRVVVCFARPVIAYYLIQWAL